MLVVNKTVVPVSILGGKSRETSSKLLVTVENIPYRAGVLVNMLLIQTSYGD